MTLEELEGLIRATLIEHWPVSKPEIFEDAVTALLMAIIGKFKEGTLEG